METNIQLEEKEISIINFLHNRKCNFENVSKKFGVPMSTVLKCFKYYTAEQNELIRNIKDQTMQRVIGLYKDGASIKEICSICHLCQKTVNSYLYERGVRPKLNKETIAKNRVLNIYKCSAKNRNLSFNLDKNLFYRLISANCFYCGAAPSNKTKLTHYNFELLYNGIDRVNSKLGYLPGNVRSCCKICNIAKASMTENEFVSWIQRICNFQNLHSNPSLQDVS